MESCLGGWKRGLVGRGTGGFLGRVTGCLGGGRGAVRFKGGGELSALEVLLLLLEKMLIFSFFLVFGDGRGFSMATGAAGATHYK